MTLSAKVKNGLAGSFCITIGFIILLVVLILPTYNDYVASPNSFSIDTSTISIQNQNEKIHPIMSQRQLSTKIIVNSLDSINIDMQNLSFKLSDQYKDSIKLFKTKSINYKKNPEKEFKKFIEELGLILNENGEIVDVTGSVISNDFISCQVSGYFPDKPYIKPNCSF